MSLKTFFSIILTGLLCLIVTTSAADAGAIFPEEAIREEALRAAPVDKKIIHLTIEITGKKIDTLFTIDTRDGLNADEAAFLAILINPSITELRREKGLLIPQLIKSGVLPPIRVLANEGTTGPVSWLPPERLQLALKTSRAISGTESGNSLELESSWLEWQASEAARLHLYRVIKSRKTIGLLRQIQNTYKSIYKATSEERFRGQYPEQRATARIGYKKMKTTIKREQKKLSAARVALDHALGLPTYVEVPLENNISFPMPKGLPSAKELTDRLSDRRVDFMALQKGITEKDMDLMSYIKGRFFEINIFIPALTAPQWLNTAGAALDVEFPMFSGDMGLTEVPGTDGKRLYKDYKRRIKTAKEDIARLLRGIGFIDDELGGIEKTLPALIKAAEEAEGSDNTIEAMQKKKTLLAVRLLRLRLRGRLMDTAIALEIASGTRLF